MPVLIWLLFKIKMKRINKDMCSSQRCKDNLSIKIHPAKDRCQREVAEQFGLCEQMTSKSDADWKWPEADLEMKVWLQWPMKATALEKNKLNFA